MLNFLLYIFFAVLCCASEPVHRVQRTGKLDESAPLFDFGVVDPNARSVRIHFSKFDIPQDASVTVFNFETNEQHQIDGWRKGSFLALSLDGNVAAMKLDAGSSWEESHGVEVDYIEMELRTRRSLSDPDWDDFMEGNVENVACVNGDSAMMKNIKSVVKIKISSSNGNSHGSGFFFGAYNRVMTNKHVLGNMEDPYNAEVEINYECTTCNGDLKDCQFTSVFKANVRSLLWSDDDLDAALLSLDYDCDDDFPFHLVAPFDEISSNYFPAPNVGDKVYMIHHPKGWPKKISRKEDGSKCRIIDTTSNTFKTDCDSIGGSSGSPVFRDSDDKLIGLHYAGNCSPQAGLDAGECSPVAKRFDQIWDKMKDTQFKCCAKFSKNNNANGNENELWRICDDVAHLPSSFNDKFKSVYVTPECKVKVYADEHFGGSSKYYYGDSGTTNFASNWDNRVSSVRFVRTDNDRCWVRFYLNSGQDGNYVFFTGDQAVLYKWNDEWSSMEMESNCRVFVYKHSHFRGSFYEYSSGTTSLGLNNQISSFRLIPDADECKVTLYQGSNCSGTSAFVKQDYFDLSSTSWNDKIRSIKADPGCGIVLYKNSQFNGEYQEFEEGGSCHTLDYMLFDTPKHFRSKASSLRVYKAQRQIN